MRGVSGCGSSEILEVVKLVAVMVVMRVVVGVVRRVIGCEVKV